MALRLKSDWRKILRRAWSMRLIGLALLLSGCEVAVQVMIAWDIKPPIPPLLFAALAGFVTTLAGAARLLSQKDF